jgi:ribosomal subunit interface protein
MRIEIQARGFALTDGLHDHVERRLQFALSWIGDEARTIRVCLFDVNGPRGGNDQRCRIEIPVRGLAEVIVEDGEADLYIAIDRAADRAERTLARRLERLREHRQRSQETEQAAAAG